MNSNFWFSLVHFDFMLCSCDISNVKKERKKDHLFSQAQRKQYDSAIYVEHSNIVIIMSSRNFAL
jgi:hypothetical protein